jgi:hypothetical protein
VHVHDRPRRRRRAHAAALAFAAALFVAACGGGGESDGGNTGSASVPTEAPATVATAATATTQPPSARDLIKNAIELALASGDPAAACGVSVTTAYVERSYGDRAACEAAISAGGTARSVRVSQIAAGGDSATAVAIASGGPLAGQRLDVALLRDGERWRLDSVSSNVPVGP